MQMRMPRTIFEQLLRYCSACLPDEACGVLIGTIDDSTGAIHEFVPLTNQAVDRADYFEADPAEWTKVLFRTMDTHRSILGLLHSHPASPPVPSTFDLNTLWYTLPSHWIVSLSEANKPAVEAFCFKPGGTYEKMMWVVAD